MFDSIGWGEVLVIALAALFIFGPERLPTLAKDAATGLKKLREAITGMRAQMNESLGDDLAELRDLDLRKYHPRTFLRDQLFGDDPDYSLGLGDGTGSGGLAANGTGGGAPGSGLAGPAVRSRDAGTPPPFDLDAT